MLIVGQATLARTDIEELPGEQPGMDNPGPPPPHVHDFRVCTSPAWNHNVNVGEGYVRAGERLTIGIELLTESDHCVAEGCTIEARCPGDNLPVAGNWTLILEWSDGGAGGQFGRWDGGVFDPNADPSLVNCYEAPATPGVYELKALIDDQWQEFEGAPLADDQPAWTEASKITVWEFSIGLPVNEHPYLDRWIPFQARIRPEVDHLERPMARQIHFWLSPVSHEPGYCLNMTREGPPEAPWKGTGIGDNDFKLAPDQTGFVVSSSEGPESTNYDQAETAAPTCTTDLLAVWCLDFGGWCVLNASVRELPPGDPTEHPARRGTMGPNPMLDKYGAPWPVDDDFNQIWDGMPFGTADPDADNEPDPMGLGVYGDGFSVYEEYRGWVVATVWLECDPIAKKDVFIYRDDMSGFPTGKPLLSISYFMQLGYGIQDALMTNEVHHAADYLSVVCEFGGSHRGRNNYAITLIRGWHDLKPSTQLGGTGPEGHWFLEQGFFCIVDLGNLEDLGATPLMVDVATAHELGHALALRPQSGGGHCHTPSVGCIMDDASWQPATTYCDQFGLDPPCVLMHSILMPWL